MKARVIPLAQVHIQNPCPASWDAMHGDATARTCDACGKQVHNLSSLTTDAASKLLNERTDSICVCYEPARDDTVKTLDYQPVAARRNHRWWIIGGIAFSAVTAVAQVFAWSLKPVALPARGLVMGSLPAIPLPPTPAKLPLSNCTTDSTTSDSSEPE